jgi:hypothetical protein
MRIWSPVGLMNAIFDAAQMSANLLSARKLVPGWIASHGDRRRRSAAKCSDTITRRRD